MAYYSCRMYCILGRLCNKSFGEIWKNLCRIPTLSFLTEYPYLACGLRCSESQQDRHLRRVDIKYFMRLSFTERGGSLTDAARSFLGSLGYESCCRGRLSWHAFRAFS